MTLGQKIKKLRTDKGLTQKDLADQVYVTFQTVSKWEKDENEPDLTTMKAIAKLFGVTVDYLINDDEDSSKKEEKEMKPAPVEQITKTIIIHQKELHVCEKCKKDIPEDELAMEQVCTRPAGRGHAAEYRQAYYHKSCLEELKKEREEKARREKAFKAARSKKLSFGWGIAGGVVAFVVTLLVLLLVPQCKEVINPGIAVLLSFIASYGIFAMLYCIITGSYIADVFVWGAGLSIRFPGLIFSWDIDGVIWVITMKILFAILGFLVGVFALVFAIALSAALGAVSFPFILIHNIHTNYEDAL